MKRLICAAAILVAGLLGSSAVGTTSSAHAQWFGWGGPRYSYYARPYYTYRGGMPYYGYQSYYAPYAPYTTNYYAPGGYYYSPGYSTWYW